MSWEMTMSSIMSDAPYILAILGTTAAGVSLGVAYIKNLRVKKRFYEFANGETESALISADRVLKNGATPHEVRRALLCMLETMADPDLGKAFTQQFAASNNGKRKRPGASNPLLEELDKLHASNPELAADAHNALMGVILAIPLMHADKVKVSEIVGLEYVGEGATNPSRVFDRAIKALSFVDHRPPPGVGPGLLHA